MVACSDSGKAGLCGRNKVPHLGGRIRGVGVNTCTYALCLHPLSLSLSIFHNLPSRSFLHYCLPFAFLSPSLCPSILLLSLPLLFLPSTFLLFSPFILCFSLLSDRLSFLLLFSSYTSTLYLSLKLPPRELHYADLETFKPAQSKTNAEAEVPKPAEEPVSVCVCVCVCGCVWVGVCGWVCVWGGVWGGVGGCVHVVCLVSSLGLISKNQEKGLVTLAKIRVCAESACYVTRTLDLHVLHLCCAYESCP